MTAEPGDFSVLLLELERGEAGAFDRVYAQVYGELRRLANHQLKAERADHSLQPTALVHEAYVKLVGPSKVSWANRNHFFALAAQAMRRVLVDHARSRGRKKRGGNERPLPLELAMGVALDDRGTDVVALDEALRRLHDADPLKAQVVELRFFGGLSHEQVAELLGISLRTVERHWAFARAWLYRELDDDGG